MSTGGDWERHALAAIRAAGHRDAKGRRALVELLAREPCALSAREIDDALRARGRAIGLATVYRNLELLVALRLASRLDVGQGVTRYERLLPSGEHHHHHVCDRCGRVTPFGDSGLERSIRRLSRELELSVVEHEVVLHGACRTCAAAR